MQTSGQFSPLEITFRMETPICLTYPFIFFDAVIAHLRNRCVDPEGYRALPSKKVVKKASEIDIPIKKMHLPNGDYIYHSSVSIFDFSEGYVTTIYKRFCEKYLNYGKIKRKKIDRGRGYFRDYMIKLVYVPAKTVAFYVNGDAEQIEKLLEGLPALGKKTAIGFGVIKDFKIKEIKEDKSIICNGKAMRPIPIDALSEAEEIVLMAYKPPYWAKENHRPCVPPFARCMLWKGSGKNTS